VAWTSGADHRQVVVTDGSYESMHAEARSAAREAGRPAVPALADIAPIDHHRSRRTVLLASAAAAEIASLLEPLVEAGVIVDRVLTPAAALVSLARARRADQDKSRLVAYAAIDETRGCLALIRDGILLGAVDMSWGYVEEIDGQRAPRARDDVAMRLTDDLLLFIDECRVGPEGLRHISICGGVPEMRSMTMALTEQFDIEVEPLDSLFAIDEARLPGDAAEFREHAPALRLAWAAAADPHPPIDLLRMRRRRAWGVRLTRVVVAAGTVAGLVLGWQIQEHWHPVMAFASNPAASPGPQLVRTASAGQVAARPAVDSTRPASPPPPAIRLPASSSVGHASPPLSPPPPAVARPVSAPPTPRVVQRPVFRLTPEPVPIPAVTPPPQRMSVRPGRLAAPLRQPESRDRISAAVAPPVQPSRRIAPVVDEAALPFDAALETILYGQDRRLAMVDGRIVATGDVVRGATIVEITANAILLRDSRGRLRRLVAGGQQR
jgi:hypothetical protein